MKKFLLLCFVLSALQSNACDMCNFYLGINPNFNKNSIGLRYRERSYIGEHSHSGTHTHEHTTSSMKEIYQTYELWGRWYPTPKVQTMVCLPYCINTDDEGKITGLGDAILLTQFQLYNTPPDTVKKFRQRIFAGGGIKLPTGTFKKTFDEELNPHMQPGSGSIDFIIACNYTAKYKNFGLAADGSYKINTSNKNNFLFANRLNASLNVFYSFSKNTKSLIPMLGLYYEQGERDIESNIYLGNTGGKVAFINTGIDLYFKKISVNLSYQIPAYEKLNGTQAQNQNRIIAGINYSFN